MEVVKVQRTLSFQVLELSEYKKLKVKLNFHDIRDLQSRKIGKLINSNTYTIAT